MASVNNDKVFILKRAFSDGVRLVRRRLRSRAVQSLPGVRVELQRAGRQSVGEHHGETPNDDGAVRALLQRTAGQLLGCRAGDQMQALLSLSLVPCRPEIAVNILVSREARVQRPKVRPSERTPVSEHYSSRPSVGSGINRHQSIRGKISLLI